MLISAECEIADPFAAACHGHVTKNTTLVKFIKFIPAFPTIPTTFDKKHHSHKPTILHNW